MLGSRQQVKDIEGGLFCCNQVCCKLYGSTVPPWRRGNFLDLDIVVHFVRLVCPKLNRFFLLYFHSHILSTELKGKRKRFHFVLCACLLDYLTTYLQTSCIRAEVHIFCKIRIWMNHCVLHSNKVSKISNGYVFVSSSRDGWKFSFVVFFALFSHLGEGALSLSLI